MTKQGLRSLKESAVRTFFLMNGVLTIIILVGIFALLLYSAVPAFREVKIGEFLTSTSWDPTSPVKAEYGILSMIVSTVMVTLVAVLIAFPIGLGVAAYLSDVAHWRVREIVKPIVEILAGIPSVVVGFLGIVLFGPFLAGLFGRTNGLNALNGAVLLAIMALPTIISISEDAINSVPGEYKAGAIALGATHWQTLRRVIIHGAMPGIIAASMLGIGRVFGETMAVMMVTGNAAVIPKSLLQPVRTLTATIAAEMGEAVRGSEHFYALFAIGIVLFIISFAINVTADLFLNRGKKR
jgi:phosphate transport system permease protein